MVILTSLMATLIVLGLTQVVLSILLIRQRRSLRQTELRMEHFNDALALLTEATQTGFHSTAAELQRLAAVHRHRHGELDVQRRLEHAAALGESIPQLASHEGLSEGEVQLRLHLARANSEGPGATENHRATM